MASLTIKNIPNDLYERLKALAKANRRGINSEVIMLLKASLQKPRPDVALIAAKAAKVRERTAHYMIDDAQLEAWING
ncbi:MAG: Arc family DNA-binding protein [Anaerolineales bacterium]|nr:Arc family DNA-binding protein [Anaerolineales bacterium]